MLRRAPSLRLIGPATLASVLMLLGGPVEAGGIWHLGRETQPRPAAAKPGEPGAPVAGQQAVMKTPEGAKPAESLDRPGVTVPAAPEAAATAEPTARPAAEPELATELAKEGAKEVLKGTIDTLEKEAAKPAEKPEQNAAAKPEVAAEQGKDYYRTRAEHILKGENASVASRPHPLAAAHPGMDVVVCQGGCRHENTAEIVYIQPTSRKVVTTVGELQTTAASAASETPTGPQIVCVGGCYEGYAKQYSSAATVAGGVGEWTTSVTPPSAPKARAGSGDWMRRIDETTDKSPQKR